MDTPSVRVNLRPVESVHVALAIGLVMGLIVRFLERRACRTPQEVDLEHKPTIEEAKFHLGQVFLPFLWPVWRGARAKYERTTDAAREAAERAKEMDFGKRARRAAQKAEAWVEEEIAPAVETGWKKV